MNKFHVTVLALLFAGSAVLGAVAVTRTTHLGTAAQQANDASISTQSAQLTAYASKLRQQLKTKMPALPPLPKASPSAAGGAGSAAAPRIVYRQPPPVVVTLHKHHGEDGGDGGGGGGD